MRLPSTLGILSWLVLQCVPDTFIAIGAGRDYNQYGFSVWLAGTELKHGLAYGATDEIGLRAVENQVAWHEFHATVLHLLGIDHERLTYYLNGIHRRLTNVHGELLTDILA